jgi:hypothetical protein
MKSLVSVFTIVLFSVNALFAQQAVNRVVVIDLSDRVLNPDAIKADKEVLNKLIADFQQQVKKNLIIKSSDRFSVIILEQKNCNYKTDYYAENLSLDMAALSIDKKAKELKKFCTNAGVIIDKLYKDAKFSNTSKDYAGVDMWEFFNNKLSYCLKKGYKNEVYVLTDGYFDFESYAHVVKDGNRFTSSQFLKNITGIDWKKKATKENYGYVRIAKKMETFSCIVVGIDPKTNDLYAQDKISFFWEKWLKEMGINEIKCLPILPKTNLLTEL